MSDTTTTTTTIVVATRLHIGNASTPPSDEDLESKVVQLSRFCVTVSVAAAAAMTTSATPTTTTTAVVGVIAVDATPKIDGYDLVDAVRRACQKVYDEQQEQGQEEPMQPSSPSSFLIRVVPVSPWGKFVLALNALIMYASSECHADYILFVSAETTASTSAMTTLLSRIFPQQEQKQQHRDTLVVGALLPGHEYHGHSEVPNQVVQEEGNLVELNGRTCPWNTLAIWDLSKLSLTGFQLVSDGLLTDDKADPSFGVEEVVATCLLQKLLGQDDAKAKLVRFNDDDGVCWDTKQFEDDPERQKWHEMKMKSKLTRAARQLELMRLSGKVYHL